MTARHARPRRRPRLLALVLVGGLVLAAPGLVSRFSATTAEWRDSETAAGILRAATIPPVTSPLACTQYGALVPTWIVVTWAAPASLPAGAEYEIRVSLGPRNTRLYSATPSVKFEVALLTNILDFLINPANPPATMEVRPVLRDAGGAVLWRAPVAATRTIYYISPILGLLLGGFRCGN